MVLLSEIRKNKSNLKDHLCNTCEFYNKDDRSCVLDLNKNIDLNKYIITTCHGRFNQAEYDAMEV